MSEASRHQTGGHDISSGLLHENSKAGGSKHSELLPLPFPDWRRRRVRASPALTGDSEESYRFGVRMAGRIGESVSALNSLGGASARSTRRASFVFEGHQAGSGVTAAQESALRRIGRLVKDAGPCPSGLTPKLAFEEVIKSKDMYSLNRCSVATYDLEKLKITKSDTVPKPAADLLPPLEADFLTHPELHIIRSEEEINEWCTANKDFQPYWDETLRNDREARLDLYRRLHEKGLLGFRKRIKCKVGIFFVKKASGKGIRLIIDSRMPNGCHRRPPKTKLGGASAICELDCFMESDELGAVNEGFGGPVELPQKLFGSTGDVSDAFYQFSVEPMCEWFGLDDPVAAEEFGLTKVWDSEVGDYVDLSAGDRVFPVFLGMPQGWAWALHFCNLAVEYNMSKAIPSSQFVKEGLPPPDPRRGPIGSVYVDNIGVFGFVEKMVDQSFDEAVCCLERAGFVLHELERGAIEAQNVGIVIRRDTMTVRHTRKRAWRLYLALKHVLKQNRITTEAMRVLVGHIVHYFSIMRPGLSVLYHTYKFIFDWLDGRSHNIPGSVKRELRVVAGLVFLVEIDLKASYCDRIYCGDSSTYGYCFQWSPSTASEQRELFKFHERWRFLEVEQHTGLGLGSHHSWSADLSVPDIAYVRWLTQRIGIADPNSDKLESGSRGHTGSSQGRQFTTVDLVGLVPRLPDEIVTQDRWQTIFQGRWQHGEAIHMKEGRVALMSLRREAKRSDSHGKRLLTLCDNLSATCAFDKGRAKDLSLLALCRRAGAIQIATGIRWHLRYVESSRNPSDHDSRVFPSKSKATAAGTGHASASQQLSKQLRGAPGAPLKMRTRSEGEATPLPVVTTAGSSSRYTHRTQTESEKGSGKSPQVAKCVLELFSGTGRLTSAFHMKGLRVGPPFDICGGECYDLCNPKVQAMIKGWLRSGRIWYLHLGTPCTHFSIANNNRKKNANNRRSYKCAHFTADLIRLCVDLGVYFSLENPKTSRLFKLPCIQRALKYANAFFVEFDCCRFGCSYRKPTYIANNMDALGGLGKRCNCGIRRHEHLRGRVRIKLQNGNYKWFWKTTLAGEYSAELCHEWAEIVRSQAPSAALRGVREPQVLPGWLDEICQVTGTVPKVTQFQPCPYRQTCPWTGAVETWGTEDSCRQKSGKSTAATAQSCRHRAGLSQEGPIAEAVHPRPVC